MTDLATLGLRFENEGLDAQNRGLDQLTEKSARAQKATDALAAGHKRATGQMLATGQMQAAVFKTVETQAHVSSLAIRESLVLVREASVGNFTRMAGSASLLAQSLSTSGTSLGGFIKALLTMTGVIKTTSDVELAADAAAAAGAAGAIQARLNQAQANILAADTEYALAKAQLQVAGTAEAQVAARAALTAANEASTAAALEATIAETALATANTAAAETATAAAAAETAALAPLAPLIIGLGLLAVATGTLIAAWAAGRKDANDFSNAIAKTGNYAGITAGQYEDMVSSIRSSTDAGFGEVRKTLLSVVSTGHVTGDAVKLLSEDIIGLARDTGQSATKVAAEFDKMGDKPAEFAERFNSSYHLMTFAQLEHIRLLEEQGNTTEAVLAAAIAIHEDLGKRGPKNLGYLEQAWRGVAGAIGEAWEALKSFGRDTAPNDQLRGLDQRIAQLQAGNKGGYNTHTIELLQQQRAVIAGQITQQEKVAAASAQSAQDTDRATAAADRMRNTWAHMGDNAARARDEIAKYRADIEAIRKVDPHSNLLPTKAQQVASEADIRKKWMPDTYKHHTTPRDTTDEHKDAIDQLIAQTKGAELQAQMALTHGLQERADLQKQVLTQELVAKQAQIDKQIHDIADDKGLSAPKKAEYTKQLEAVKLAQAHVTSLQQQKVDDDTALALRAQEMDQLKTAADLQQRILNAQLGMATTYAGRAAIEQRIFEAKQAQEKLEFDYTEALKLRNQQITPEQDAANRADFATAQAGEASAFGRNQYLDAHPVQKWLEQVGDATDRSRQRGELMVQTMNNFADSMAAAVVNAKDLGDTAKSVFRQMVQDLLADSIRQLEGTALKTGASMLMHFLPGFATGTNYAPGGMAIVGEKGPEIVNLPRGSQVIPNDAVRGSNDNARSPIVFDMRGAVVTEDLLHQMNRIAANGDAQVAQYADDRARQHAAAARNGAAKDAIRAAPAAQRSYAKLGTAR